MRDIRDEKDEKSKDRIGLVGAGIGVVVTALWLATPFVVKWLYPDLDKQGQFGDLFGSINALFSGLAFVGVIVAILLQKQELALQRQELTETRLEMRRTADAQEAAHQALNKTIWAQSFKVALDILEQQKMKNARHSVWTHRDAIYSLEFSLINDFILDEAENVARGFEAVGTMVRKGLLPADYMVDTWSVPIARNWLILKPYLESLRGKRSDPFIAQEFEYLATVSNEFLAGKKVLVSM